MLDSRYAMWLGWGPDFTFFYNDAYARMTLGPKHPWALGRPAREVWSEIWADVGPRAESVVHTGQATWDEGLLLFLGAAEVQGRDLPHLLLQPRSRRQRAVGGMLCVVTEDTERTIGERRLRTLRELATNTNDKVQSVEEACRTAARTLAENPHDLPFALIYLLDADAKIARLAGAAGLAGGRSGAPAASICRRPAIRQGRWPMRAVLDSGQAQLVTQLDQRFGPIRVRRLARAAAARRSYFPWPGRDRRGRPDSWSRGSVRGWRSTTATRVSWTCWPARSPP